MARQKAATVHELFSGCVSYFVLPLSVANLVSTCIYMFPTVFVFPQFEFLSVFKNFCIVPLRFARTVDRTRLYFEIKTVFLDLSLSHVLSSNFSRYSELCYVPRECLAGLAVTK